MIDHFIIKVKDINQSKQFYEEVLKTLGVEKKLDFGTSASFGEKVITSGDPAGGFWLSEGKPERIHFAFSANSKEDVNAFYEAALKAGGKGNGEPGPRPDVEENYYAAYVFDLDGYNIEAVYHGK